jgi:hypothetical protein
MALLVAVGAYLGAVGVAVVVLLVVVAAIVGPILLSRGVLHPAFDNFDFVDPHFESGIHGVDLNLTVIQRSLLVQDHP